MVKPHHASLAAFAEYFWSRIDRTAACWLWPGPDYDYGRVYLAWDGQRPIMGRAHRVAWMLTNGSIPDALEVCHRCDIPRCVRPAHLFLGTHRENLRDARDKGRGNPP